MASCCGGKNVAALVVNLREIVLGVLTEVTEGEAYSSAALSSVLEKYQYLDKRDRAFISRVTEGTLENLIRIDYIIECFSKVPIYNMKPLIRNLLRISVYQLYFLTNVPDSAVVKEGRKYATLPRRRTRSSTSPSATPCPSGFS